MQKLSTHERVDLSNISAHINVSDSANRHYFICYAIENALIDILAAH